MSLIVFVAVYAIGAFVSAPVHAQTNFTFNNDLTMGSTGADVSALQGFLIEKGFSIPAITSGAAASGYFGSQTMSALMQYQASLGLSATGYFGSVTRVRVNLALAGVASGGGSIPSSTNCPAGYICTPNIPSVINCPAGYVCTSNTSGTGMMQVMSPNGEEVWPPNSTRSITWSSGNTAAGVSIYAIRNMSGCFKLPAGQSCLMIADPEYTIASNISNTGRLDWNVGTYVGSLNTSGEMLQGSYYIRICPGTERSTASCDTSNSVFTVGTTSTTSNQSPVINGSVTLLRSCPQTQVTERRLNGNTGGSDVVAQYYLLTGQRREFTEFDRSWVGNNCSVALQTSYVN